LPFSRSSRPALLWRAALLVAMPAGAQQTAPATPQVVPAGSPRSVAGPPVLPNRSRDPGTVEVTLTAAPARLTLVAGAASDVFAYNSQIPGPTLDVREGDRVVVHFENRLPVPTTVHWHGLHIPATADGSPFHPVPPGGRRDYVFTLLPGSAGTYWYHPHPHHQTGYQVAKGLYGAIVVRAPDDPIPAAVEERLLVLHDNRFDAGGAVDLPASDSPRGRVDFENGREGDVLFVNGEVLPTIPIRAGAVQRWRIVNASAARVYRLVLPGHTLVQVGSDGGLFEHPVELTELVLANGERAEVLVRATGAPGSRAVLETRPYDRYVPQTRPADWQRARPLLTLAYVDSAPVQSPVIPPTLRHVPAIDTTRVAARRVFALSQGMINGKLMDPDRVDVAGRLGTTEIWEIENLVGMDHPFHLHGYQFQLLDRDGMPEPQRRWKDTVNLPKHSTARLVVRFDRYPGKWMYHCHILDHEDHGMMGVLEISP